MDKFIIRLVCCFVPSPKKRHMYRKCSIGRYEIIGMNNTIQFMGCSLPKFLKIKGLDISIQGDNNHITIGHPNKSFKDCKFIIRANNATYDIGDVNFMHKATIVSAWGNNQQFYFGDNSDCNELSVFLMEENTSVVIGKDTIMSTGITIRPTDIHTIIDIESEEVINKTKHPVIIGEHCWISQGVTFLKGARIPNNTIVGAQSLVTKEFTTEDTIIAGVPAKQIRKGVRWDLATPFAYSTNKGNLNE